METTFREQKFSPQQIALAGVAAAFLIAILFVVVTIYRNGQLIREKSNEDTQILATIANIQRHGLLMQVETNRLLSDPSIGLDRISEQRSFISAQLRALKGLVQDKAEILAKIQEIDASLNEFDALLSSLEGSPQDAYDAAIPAFDALFEKMDREQIKRAYDLAERGFFVTLSEILKAQENAQQWLLGLWVSLFVFVFMAGVWQIRTTRNRYEQQKEQVKTLEEHVAERTKALTTVAEISTAASTILDIDKIMQEVVNLAKERFGLYHAHIYLLDSAGENLVLASGAGEPGREMVAQGRSIPLSQERSLVARAARDRRGVTVNDVTQELDFLPNPLLPDTRSELAVPMLIGEKVIGVFDVQSDVTGRFTEADIDIQTTLASQVASAVQNARSYTELQRSQSLLSEALNISRLANWEYDVKKDLFTFNDQFYAIFRTSFENIGSYKLSSADYARLFVHPEDAPLVGAEIQRVLDSKERFLKTELEHRIIFSGGEVGYITVKINVERDENGDILRWYGANQDVTERRRLEEQNRKRATQQEAINTITQKIQSATTIEAALQVTARELGHALGMKPTTITIASQLLDDKKSDL